MEILSKDHQLNLISSKADGASVDYIAIVNSLADTETEKSFNFSIDAKQLEKIKQYKLEALAKVSNINGFRPGKAPVSVLWKKHKDQLTYEIIDEAVNNCVNTITNERKLNVVSNPKTSNEVFDLDTGIKFDVTFVTLPEVALPDFTKLSIEKPIYDIAQTDITSRIAKLLTLNKKYDEAKTTHKAVIGDKAVIDFVGKIDGVTFDGGSGNDHSLELGSHSFIDNFEEQLVDKKAGDQVLVKVKFPDEYHAKQFAGKNAEFDVTIKQILAVRPLNDETELLSLAGLGSSEELHTQIKSALEAECKKVQTMKMKSSLLDQLDKVFAINIPQAMLDEEFAALMKQVDKTDKDKPEQQVKDEYLTLATRRVKLGILLAEIAKTVGIDISRDDITKAVTDRALSAGSHEYAQAIIQYYTKNKDAVEQLKGPILETKTVEYLFGQVKNIDKPVTIKELLELED